MAQQQLPCTFIHCSNTWYGNEPSLYTKFCHPAKEVFEVHMKDNSRCFMVYLMSYSSAGTEVLDFKQSLQKFNKYFLSSCQSFSL